MTIPTTHDTSLYTLGKGVVWIAEWSAGSAGTYYDVGNSPKFDVEVIEETLDHLSSRSGTKKKDKRVILETGYTITFDLDEISVLNVSRMINAHVSGRVLSAQRELEREFAIKFVSDNPYGPDQRWEFWKCSLKSAGPISLITDEWTVLSFTAEGLEDSTNNPTILLP